MDTNRVLGKLLARNIAVDFGSRNAYANLGAGTNPSAWATHAPPPARATPTPQQVRNVTHVDTTPKYISQQINSTGVKSQISPITYPKIIQPGPANVPNIPLPNQTIGYKTPYFGAIGKSYPSDISQAKWENTSHYEFTQPGALPKVLGGQINESTLVLGAKANVRPFPELLAFSKTTPGLVTDIKRNVWNTTNTNPVFTGDKSVSNMFNQSIPNMDVSSKSSIYGSKLKRNKILSNILTGGARW